MNGAKYFEKSLNLLRSVVLLSLILLHPGFAQQGAAKLHEKDLPPQDQPFVLAEKSCERCGAHITSSPPLNTGPVLVVTNTSMEENGKYWDPFMLIDDPGPDGISYAEAIHAVGADNGLHETITFDPSLSGAIIDTSQGHNNAVTADGFTLDGDLDDDGDPDITLDGNNQPGNGIWLWGASHVLIEGLNIRNYVWGGIRMTNNIETSGFNVFEDIVIRNNRFSGIGHKGVIEINIENEDNSSVSDIEIIGNTILDDSLGVNIEASWGGNSYNQISHVSIISNTITGGIHIYAAGGFQSGSSNNTVSDVVIRGNQINGDAINLAGSNRDSSYKNVMRDVVVANNQINVSPVAIRLASVTENGINSHDNLVENITFTDNTLRGGGFYLGGALAAYTYNNTLSGVLIDRNQISSSAANGIYVIAGDYGAHHNRIENAVIRNSLVAFCNGTGVLLAGKYEDSNYNAIQDVMLNNLTLVNNGIGTAWAGGLNIDTKSIGNIISGVTVSNTIMWDNNFDDVIRGSEIPDSVAYSILNDVRFTGNNGNIYESPEFVDPTSWDYSLQASSPGVDSGDPAALNVGPLDLDGNLRLWEGNEDTIAVVDRGAWEYGAIQPQEIDVEANLYPIFDGDMIPGYWDGTDFGLANINGEMVEHAFSVQNTGSLSLTLSGDPTVVISGTHPADFSIVEQPESSVPGGNFTTFTIGFNPTQLGLRNAVISIENDDIDENPYTFSIKGTAITKIYKCWIPMVIR